MLQSLKNIFHLGLKELCGLWRDPLLMALIIYSFSVGVYISANAQPDSLTKATIAIVDEDKSPLTFRISEAFLPPMFKKPHFITLSEIDKDMDRGKYTFVLVFPVDFQRDVMAGKNPTVQLNVDATRMSQAFTGSGYIQQIIATEIADFDRSNDKKSVLAEIVLRNRFNFNLTRSWFSSVVELINTISLLAIVLTGAALIRERERGTLEHLLVMPVTPLEIMISKIWSMALVVMVTAGISLLVVIEGILKMPVSGSRLLFMAGMAIYLFAVTSLGIFLGCVAKNMPQLGILLILILLPLQMLSGGMTPLESMPGILQYVVQIFPTTHFVACSQAILFRGAGFSVVWYHFLALMIIGMILFQYSLFRFKKSVA